MAVSVRSEIVQVTNISPSATSEQMRTLFGHIGVLDEFVIYPPDDKEEPASKVCYIRYQDAINAEVALHLNNTVFLDRALIVLPLAGGHESIPDEKYANLVRAPPNTAAGVLPRTADWPLNVISMVVGRPGEQVIQTLEPRLSSLSFPLYPPLPATTDGSRIEEIRRTILVTNLDPKTTGDQVLDFFNKHAEVRCVRMAGTEFDRAAYVEFTQQPSIVKAFGLMGCTLNGRQIMIQHSNCAIIKPANNLALLDDASKRNASDLQSSKDHGSKHSDRGRTRSRSRDRRSRSRRRSTSRRRRTRSKDRRRSRSRSHRSYGRRRSRTRSRSRSRNRRKYSRSRSRDRRRSDRGRSRSRNRRRYRSRSRSGKRYSSRSRSRGRRDDRRGRDKDRLDRSARDRNRDKDRDRNRDSERRDKDRDKTRNRDKERDRSRDKIRKSRDEESTKSATDSRSNGTKETVNVTAESSKKTDVSSPRKSKRASSGSSYNSGSDNESVNESVAENKQLDSSQINGDNGESNSPNTPIKPTVVGVKLAGPEDMDHLATEAAQTKAIPSNDQSPANSDSSGDAMDTEA